MFALRRNLDVTQRREEEEKKGRGKKFVNTFYTKDFLKCIQVKSKLCIPVFLF